MKSKPIIYLLDDCESTVFLIKKWLEDDFEVMAFLTPLSFIDQFKQEKPHLCILDVQLNANRNGLDVLKEIQLKNKIHLPFIFISTEVQKLRRQYAYELGAVDFIQKPFDKKEFKHKISNILSLISTPQEQNHDIISLDEDNLSFIIKSEYEEKKVKLTPKEFIIFKQLINNKDMIVTREQILTRLEITLKEQFTVDRVIDVHVCNIKKKLGPHKKVISSIYGIGYKYDSSKVAA